MKKFHVMTLNGDHEYDIEITETDSGRTFKLYYSKSNEWSKPGTFVMAIDAIDQDCSVDLPKKLGRNIDVSMVNELSLLLRFSVMYGQEQHMADLQYNVVPAEGYKI